MKIITSVIIVSLFLISCQKDSSSCDDNIKNQNEIDTDCGGDCAPCSIYCAPTGPQGLNVLYGE